MTAGHRGDQIPAGRRAALAAVTPVKRSQLPTFFCQLKGNPMTQLDVTLRCWDVYTRHAVRSDLTTRDALRGKTRAR